MNNNRNQHSNARKARIAFIRTLKVSLAVSAVFDVWLILSSNDDQMVYAKLIIVLATLLAFAVALAVAVHVDTHEQEEEVKVMRSNIHYPAGAAFQQRIAESEAAAKRKVNYYV